MLEKNRTKQKTLQAFESREALGSRILVPDPMLLVDVSCVRVGFSRVRGPGELSSFSLGGIPGLSIDSLSLCHLLFQ